MERLATYATYLQRMSSHVDVDQWTLNALQVLQHLIVILLVVPALTMTVLPPARYDITQRCLEEGLVFVKSLVRNLYKISFPF